MRQMREFFPSTAPVGVGLLFGCLFGGLCCIIVYAALFSIFFPCMFFAFFVFGFVVCLRKPMWGNLCLSAMVFGCSRVFLFGPSL